MFLGRTSRTSQKHANGHNPKKKHGRPFVKRGRHAKRRRVVRIALGGARY